MKLIIDISDEVYANAKNGELNEIQSMYICGSICNGTPYEERPQGELISREALKEEVENLIGYSLSYEAILNAIDNAPTVEPKKVLVANVTFDKDQLEQLVRDRVIEPIKNGELVLQTDERPRGEWLEPFESNGKTYHKCTHCHISSELILFGNFCPNCGADMRGGEDNR